MIVEDDVLDADAASGFLGFGAPPRRQGAAALGLVPRVAVGDRDEADAMAERGEFRRGAARALVAVVRMRAKRDDVEFAVRRRRLRPLRRRLPGCHASRRDCGCACRLQCDPDEESHTLRAPYTSDSDMRCLPSLVAGAQNEAIGLTGEPVPLGIGNGATVNMNSHRFRAAAASLNASKSARSRRWIPSIVSAKS